MQRVETGLLNRKEKLHLKVVTRERNADGQSQDAAVFFLCAGGGKYKEGCVDGRWTMSVRGAGGVLRI